MTSRNADCVRPKARLPAFEARDTYLKRHSTAVCTAVARTCGNPYLYLPLACECLTRGANCLLQTCLSCRRFRYLQALCLKASPDQAPVGLMILDDERSTFQDLASGG